MATLFGTGPVIPAKFSMPRLGAWQPRMHVNPPSPPFSKGGWGGFESYFLTNGTDFFHRRDRRERRDRTIIKTQDYTWRHYLEQGPSFPRNFPFPRLGAWHPRMHENSPSPPFSKGGLGGI